MQIHKIMIFVKSLTKGILIIIYLAILIFRSYFGNFLGINAYVFLEFLGHRNPSPTDNLGVIGVNRHVSYFSCYMKFILAISTTPGPECQFTFLKFLSTR